MERKKQGSATTRRLPRRRSARHCTDPEFPNFRTPSFRSEARVSRARFDSIFASPDPESKSRKLFIARARARANSRIRRSVRSSKREINDRHSACRVHLAARGHDLVIFARPPVSPRSRDLPTLRPPPSPAPSPSPLPSSPAFDAGHDHRQRRSLVSPKLPSLRRNNSPAPCH